MQPFSLQRRHGIVWVRPYRLSAGSPLSVPGTPVEGLKGYQLAVLWRRKVIGYAEDKWVASRIEAWKAENEKDEEAAASEIASREEADAGAGRAKHQPKTVKGAAQGANGHAHKSPDPAAPSDAKKRRE